MRPCIKAGWLAVSVALWLANGQVQADEVLAPLLVAPSETSVLLLPALDATKDAEHMQAPRQSVIRHREQYEFITRHFRLLGDALGAKAAEAEPKIELGDPTHRTPENLDALAKRAGVDWVVNIVVEEAKLDPATANAFAVQTHVLLQIWDARRHGWLVNSAYIGQASGSGTPVFVFKNSLDDAVRSSLSNMLSAYPQVVTVSGENSLKNYLAGQAAPFIGDPKTNFAGLKAER